MQDTYYMFLKEKIARMQDEGGEFIDIIAYIPEFFRLLSDMLDEEVIEKESRLKINSALGYFVAPEDVLPDDTYGSMGLMDDCFICCYVMKELLREYKDLITKIWIRNTDSDDIIRIIDTCYNSTSEFLEEKDMKERILVYAGLKEE